MTNTNGQGMPPIFKIRSTNPGRRQGTKEWSREELDAIRSSYKAQYPAEWRTYLEYEAEKGFITNAMNTHLMAHIENLFPGLHWRHYRAGVMDFRFANYEALQFPMWKPENRELRREKFRAYLDETHNQHQSVTVNGDLEFSDAQVDQLIAHLQTHLPELWARYCELQNEIGFVDVHISLEIERQVSMLFPKPRDISSAVVGIVVFDEANRRYHFEMAKPENKRRASELVREQMAAEDQDDMPFNEWYRAFKARKDNK
ncbi:hypothetical protein ACVITL_006949 [Rhizobium pisi]